MTNKELIQKFEILVAEEKKAIRLVLEHIAMIESRKVYFDLGYDRMYSYMVKGLGYSEASAHRRIQASRVLKIDSSVGEKLEQGTLNLSQLAQVSQLSRATKILPSLALIQKLENKGKSATEQILAETFHIQPKTITHTRTQKDESVRLETTFTKEQFADLQEARNQLSHICPDGDWAQVMTELARQFNKKLKPKIKYSSPEQLRAFENTPTEVKNSAPSIAKTPPAGVGANSIRKNIRITVRRDLLQKANHRCQHIHPDTGMRCQSKYQLQVDHKFPVSWGGGNDTDNFQILCAQHNRAKGDRPH